MYKESNIKILNEQIQKLQTRCQTYQEYVERLEIEVNKRTPKDCTKHRKQIEERDTQIIELQQELNNSYKISLQQFEKQDNQMRNLRSAYEQQKQEYITMQETNSLIQKKLINEQLIVIELKERIIQLEKEQEDYLQKLNDKDKQMEVQKEQSQIAMNLFYKDIESFSKEIEKKITNPSHVIECDNYFLKGIHLNVNKIFSEISEQSQLFQDKQSQYQEQQDQLVGQIKDKLNKEILSLQEQIDSKQQLLEEQNLMISGLNQRIRELEEKITKQQEELEDLQSQESSLRYSQMGENKEIELIKDDSDYYFAI